MRSLSALRPLAVALPVIATIACVVGLDGPAASAPAAGQSASASTSSARDAAGEVSADAAPDARSDAAPDAALDAPADAAFDARSDALRPDAAPDAPGDAKGDAPSDGGGYYPDAPRPIAPDPVPLTSDAQFVLTITFAKGSITIDKVEREKLPSKQAVARRFGRFAAELYSGPTLVERVRFDFPLIADDDLAGDVYARGLVTSVKVRVPDSDRPNKLELWDRATDRRWSFTYPPALTP